MQVPYYIFRLPARENHSFGHLVEYLEENLSQCVTYFPWLTAELLDGVGPRQTIEFINQFGSLRISVEQIEREIDAGEKTINNINRLASDCGFLEVQSASGFVKDLRKFCVRRLIDLGEDPKLIAQMTGVSIRSIQRYKKSV